MKDRIDYILIIYADLDRINPEDNLQSLGIDSLDLMEIIIEIEKDFKINIEGGEINTRNTIKDLYDLVESKTINK